MNKRELEVLVNGQLVGHLREENDLWQFAYTPQWIVSPQGFDLSPALSRSAGAHIDGASNRPVQWYFDNLLPEEALRTALAKEAGLGADDAFALLAWFGGESAGSLVLRDPTRPEAAAHGVRPLALTDLSARINNLPHASLTKDAPKRMSLAGAQHKLLVILNGTDLYEPLPGTPSTHVLKPNHQDPSYPASAMNEYFTMRLAGALGLRVAAVQHRYSPQPVYLVERFDRIAPPPSNDDVATRAEAVQRRHVIDTCQLLNKARAFKYRAANLETLARAIGFCRSKTAARLQLFRWVLFNVLIGNGDNHLKNISFLVDAGGINVAPAYDLLSTAAYDTKAISPDNARWPHTSLALALNDATTFHSVTRRHLLDAGTVLGLAEKTAERELDGMLRAAPLQADKLVTEIVAQAEKAAAASPAPDAARRYFASETRLLGAARHIILADMCRQLAR